MADVDHMPPGPMDAPSLIRAVAQIVPTTRPVVKLTGPLIPSDQTEDKRWYVHDCLGKKTKSGDNWGYSQRNCGLQELPNGSTSSWTHQGEEGDGMPKCHH